MKWIGQRGQKAAFDEIEIQLTLADKISRLTVHSSSAEQIAQGIVTELGGLMPVDRARMAVLDKTKGKAILKNLVGYDDHEENDSITIANTPIAWVADNRHALLEPDPVEEKHFSINVLGEDMRTQIHMPLFYQGEVFGVLTVGSSLSNAYSEAQLRVLRYAAIHMAILLKSFLLLGQNLRTEASLTDLSELLGIITSSAELTEVFPLFAGRLRKVIPFDYLSINHVEGNIIRILASFREKGSYLKKDDVYPLTDSALLHIQKHGEISVEENIEGDIVRIITTFREKGSHLKKDDVYPFTDSALLYMQEHGEINVEENLELQNQFPIDKVHLEHGFKGAIRVPLFSHGKLFASLVLLSCEPYHSKVDTDFLKQLAQYLATPVESYIFYRHEKRRFDWLNALSHHLKTPLTPIVSSCELLLSELQEEEEGSTSAKLARNIYTSAENLKHNLNIFWTLSEIDSPDFSLKIGSADPGPILCQVVEEASAAAEAKSQSLLLKSPENLPHIFVDQQRIKQALGILIRNAIKLSPQMGNIELRVEVIKRKLIIEIVDSAQAFSPEERKRLLQPYNLTQADQMAFPQLTLDIAISRRLIEMHSGNLWISSEPGKGNIFGFSLSVLP